MSDSDLPIESKEKASEKSVAEQTNDTFDVLDLMKDLQTRNPSNSDQTMDKYFTQNEDIVAQRRPPYNQIEIGGVGNSGSGYGIPRDGGANRQPQLPRDSVHRLPETIIPQTQRTPVYTERAVQPPYGTPAEPPNGRYRRTY